MSTTDGASFRSRRLWVALPLVIFAALAAAFLAQLLSGRDAATVPSALIGQKAPTTVLPALEASGVPGFETGALLGNVTLVNVWASWCAPCREEHPLLLALAADPRIAIVGLNYKDSADNARGFLASLGNPYRAIGVDRSGRAAIDWGVYGVPETFLIGRDGTIRMKQVGPLSEAAVTQTLLPAIGKALAEPAPSGVALPNAAPQP